MSSKGPLSQSLRPDPARLLGSLNGRRRELMQPVLERPRDYVLLSVRGLGRRLKVDPATALRMVKSMGFRGYRDFQHYLHELALANATLSALMHAPIVRGASVAHLMRQSLTSDDRNMQELHKTLQLERVIAVARRVHRARRVFLLGGDLNISLIEFLRYHLALLGMPPITASAPGEVIHTVRSIGKEDLVIAIGFRRGLMHIVESLKQACSQGAYCVGITDTFVSPLARFAHESFFTSIKTPFFGVSYVAPMAFLNTFIVACANVRRPQVMKFIKQAAIEQREGFRWYKSD